MPPKTSWKERHKKKVKLTDYEKIILKCIDRDGLQYESLFRYGFRLYARGYDRTTACLVPFEYMFKFIKNGEEYKISDLLEE